MSKGKIAAGVTSMVAAILAAIYANEGGYVNHPNDPGGATRYGVTEQVARAAGYAGDMRHFPMHCAGTATVCADDIYIARYMKEPGFWPLIEADPAVAEELIDTAVNMGPPRPSRWFQESINELCAGKVAVDGQVGPKTRAAWQACRKQGGPRLCVSMLDRLDARQRAEYDWLVRVNPKLKSFHRGWINHRIGNVDRRKCAA
ncbi:MAG: glycosyl hydrolase 108 family protein [Novosphingobium sp.]